MNNFFKKVMSLDLKSKEGSDLGKLVFMCFYLDKELYLDGKYSTIDKLNRYYYEFYSDEKDFSRYTNNFIVQNILNYTNIDLSNYTKKNIQYIRESLDFIDLKNDKIVSTFHINYDDIDFFIKKLKMIIIMLFNKYTDVKTTDVYSNKISKEKFLELVILQKNNCTLKDTIIFNRGKENINYCAISEEINNDNLDVVILNENENYRNNSYNYLILNKDECIQYRLGNISIDKRGFLIKDSKVIGILPISHVKSIRDLLI